MKYTSIIISTLLFTACGDDGDWTVIITTSPATSPTTQITANSVGGSGSGDPGGESETPTTENDDTSDTDETTTSVVMTTTGNPTTGEATSGDASTGDTGTPFPPTGCAIIVEVLGRVQSAQRYITVDTTNCVSRNVDLIFSVFGAPDPQPLDLTAGSACTTYGGALSVATVDQFGLELEISGPDEPPAFLVQVFVDGVLSDKADIPLHLAGLSWPGEPMAPAEPIRRLPDWSWSLPGDHVEGCDL